MTPGAKNVNRLLLLRVAILLLYLPAHLAFVLLVDLNFIPDASPRGPLSFRVPSDPLPKKDRLRVQVRKPTDSRASATESRQASLDRDLDPWALQAPRKPVFAAGVSVEAEITQPESLLLWSTATPHGNRAPPV